MFLLILISCMPKQNNIYIYKSLENAKDFNLKELEQYDAEELFEKYKEVKICIVQKEIKNEDASFEKEKLREIINEFNRLTMSEEYQFYIDNGYTNNPYLEKFNNALIKSIVENSEDGDFIDISKLKNIYQN